MTRTILTAQTITILVIVCRVSWAEQAAAELRRAGYRPGGAGLLVLEHLEGQDCCLGAQEIYDALGRKVGLASVYRTLERLQAQGLVQRIDIGDGIVRYEPAREA